MKTLLGIPNNTDHSERAEIVIRSHVLLSMGLGPVAIPFLDTVCLSGIQLAMLRKLTRI